MRKGIRSEGEWKMIGTLEIEEENEVYVDTFTIDPALTVDALTMMPTGDFDHNVRWGSRFHFYEAQVE